MHQEHAAAVLSADYTYDALSDTINTDGTVTVPICTDCGARAKHKRGGINGHFCTNDACPHRKAPNNPSAFARVTLRRFAIPRA